MTLPEFLLARIAEDETVAREAQSPSPHGSPFEEVFQEAVELAQGEGAREPALVHITRHNPAHVLVECEAKRRIVDELRLGDPANRWAKEAWRQAESDVLRLLAKPYADHPDYDPSWRP